MKKRLLLLTMSSFMITISSGFSQVDLAIGNISAGFNSYDQNTGEISGVFFDVLNNENGDSWAFDITLHLFNTSTSTFYEVHKIEDNDGQSGNTAVTYDNIDVDFNDTQGIPAGDYRLVVCVDEADDITETDEANNCIYLTASGNNLTFNPATASTSKIAKNINEIKVYPNPANDEVTFEQKNNNNTSLIIYEITGKSLKTIALNQFKTKVDVSNFNKGLYLYKTLDEKGNITDQGKFVKK